MVCHRAISLGLERTVSKILKQRDNVRIMDVVTLGKHQARKPPYLADKNAVKLIGPRPRLRGQHLGFRAQS